MNRTFTLGALLMVLALLVAACGPAAQPTATPAATPAGTPAETPAGTPAETPAGTPAETPAETPDGTPEPTPPPGAEEGTLTLWVDETRAERVVELGQAFTEEYGVPVVVHQLGFGQIRDQLQLAGPAGEGPDIIIGAHDWLGQLVENGLLQPIDLGDKAASFDEVALTAFSYNGELYGVPYATEAIALYYNQDLVPEAPATWDELKQIALDLQADGTVDQGFILMQGDPYHSYPILSGHGGYIFGRDADGSYDPSDVGLDSEGGLAYGNELDSMIQEGILRADVDYGTMTSLFYGGRGAMMMTGPWELPNARESGINFAVAPIPAMDETPRPFVGAQGFMISADSPNQLLAQTFLTEFVASDEGMQMLFEADPRPPTWLPLAESIDDAEIQVFAESASDGDPMPAIPEMSSVWGAWTDAINLVFQQAEDPETAMQNAAEQIRGLIGQ
jgi:arabinogalactan oligomer / maltooligosaccharide transport system substrate-binding protein